MRLLTPNPFLAEGLGASVTSVERLAAVRMANTCGQFALSQTREGLGSVRLYPELRKGNEVHEVTFLNLRYSLCDFDQTVGLPQRSN